MRTIFIVMVFAFSATSACADWQYTKWGMSPEQVLTASKGQMQRCDNRCVGKSTEDATALLVGKYKSGEFAFTSFARFDKRSGKLAHISLNLDQPTKAFSLVGELRVKYGEPASHSRSAVLEFYVWREAKDQVSIVIIGNGPDASVSLSYQPRLTDSNKGL